MRKVCIFHYFKYEIKKYHIVETFSQCNRKVVERETA